ncbi:MAG: Uma2 family endonuclease, partial [Planctomycetia bacterium]|nr:Uma2 family endonuclease [Planctomycetia bacterium]
MTTPTTSVPEIEYPDSDGKPLADNTLQFQWIVTIKENLDTQYRDDPNVFVAGDLLWYPVEGRPDISAAPDTLVAFGRPKGYRGSYIQFREGGIAPQVVFEILSPNNTKAEMQRKFDFYDRYGVDEYYLYDPESPTLAAWVRQAGKLRPVAEPNGWISPRLGIRFDLSGPELVNFHPDGKPFLTFGEVVQLAEESRQDAEALRQEADLPRQQ